MSQLYSLFALLGILSVPAAFILGFRYDAAAPVGNYFFNLLLFLGFMVVHIVMLLPGFKKLIYRKPHSIPVERRIYVMISIITWLLVYILHKPVPGLALPGNIWIQYLGICGVLAGILMFFEGATLEFLNGFVATPGSNMSHSADTPLMTEGSYAKVRHPMYRGAVIYMFASLLIHPHTGQLLFVIVVALGFVLFIPFEEKALIKTRGNEYLEYMKVVRYRILPGIW